MAEEDEFGSLAKNGAGDAGSGVQSNEKAFELIKSLQEELVSERDGRKEDRFLFVVVGVVVFDAWIFTDMETWGGPVVIGLIQIFGLLVLARRSGVDEVSQWLDKVLNAVRPNRSNG